MAPKRVRPASLDELIDRFMDLEESSERNAVTTRRIESAMIGEWNDDGTYSDGFIQRDAQRRSRDRKVALWFGGVATTVITGLLIFLTEQTIHVNNAATLILQKGH